MKKSNKVFIIHALVFGIAAIYYLALNLFGITCPIRALIGYPCPACGMSRAMVSLLLIDFDGYAYYNVMAAPMILGILSAIHFRKYKEMRCFTDVYLIAAAVINLAYYVYRLLNDIAP